MITQASQDAGLFGDRFGLGTILLIVRTWSAHEWCRSPSSRAWASSPG